MSVPVVLTIIFTLFVISMATSVQDFEFRRTYRHVQYSSTLPHLFYCVMSCRIVYYRVIWYHTYEENTALFVPR